MRTILCAYRAPDGKRRRKRSSLGRSWVYVEVLTLRATVRMCGKLFSGYTGWEVARGDEVKRLWPDGWGWEDLKMPKRRGRKGSEEAKAISATPETKLLASCPHLMEHLTSREWDDGSARSPGHIMVMTQGSMFRIIAKEPDEGVQLCVYMASMDDALIQLELLLGSEEAPWEPDPFAKRTGARKSKK